MDNNQFPKFDPETGRPLTPPPAEQAPKFDPETGRPLNVSQNVPRFDPETGRPLTPPETPLSNGNSSVGANFARSQVNDEPYQLEQKKTDGIGIGALICGILSLVCCCCCNVGFVPGIVAIILAVMSKKNDPEEKMSGMAKAGLICGIIGTALSVLVFVIGIVLSMTGYADIYLDEFLGEFYY